MTTKINFSSIKKFSTIVLLIVLAISCRHKETNKPQPAVFAAGGGFGYTISIHDKILIKQETIPAVDGAAAFCDSLDAVKVSNLVVQKISKKQSPTITKQDLAALKIRIKC